MSGSLSTAKFSQLRSRTPPPPPSLTSLTPLPSPSLHPSLNSPTPARPAGYRPPARFFLRWRLRWQHLLLLILLYAGWAHLGITDLLVLARFKLSYRYHTSTWANSCSIRKEPLVFVHGDDEYKIVWESNCPLPAEAIFEWARLVCLDSERWSWRRRRRSSDGQAAWTRAEIVAITHKPSMIGGYFFQARLEALPNTSHIGYRLRTPTRSLFAHAFRHSPPVSTPATIHIAAVADNQFNVRVFHRLLRRLVSLRSKAYDLLIHAGDQVQEPDNAQQWHTDFWHPLTDAKLLGTKLGQRTPIVLARGNHDWDESGANPYTGGIPNRQAWYENGGSSDSGRRGTYYAYFPHDRVRIVVLDSNLPAESEQLEQERWLEWEVKRPEWRRASIKIAVVHVPPFIEYWERDTWEAGESQWGAFVRHRLFPILAQASTSLVISGHSHSYSRGFLPASLTRAFSSVNSSFALPEAAKAIASERGWEKTSEGSSEPGTVLTVIGGAGGSLDPDRVEDWRFYEKSVRGQHHFVTMTLSLGTGTKLEQGGRIYMRPLERKCAGLVVSDSLEWRAYDINGKIFDRFNIAAEGCRDVQ